MENFKIWQEKTPLFNLAFQNEANENAPSVDAFLIEDNKKHGAVIICPGGRYNHRSDKEGAPVAKWLNSMGINAFVLNYRVNPYTHPAPILDLKRAIRFIRYKADKFNVDVNKVGVMGFSAGGHLAGMLAEHYDEFEIMHYDEIDKINAKPDMLCLCYPVVTLLESYGHLPSVENLFNEPSDLVISLSLEKSVRPEIPPTFIWHTVEDESVSVINSLEMGKSLREAKVPFELHVFPDGKHGMALSDEVEGTGQWKELYKNWLNRIGFII